MLPCNARKTAAAVQHGGPACTGCASKIRRASGRRSTRGSSVRRPSACFAKNCAGQRFLRHPVRFLPAGGAGQTAPAASRSFGRHSVGLRHHPAAGAKPPPHGHAKQGKARQPQQQRTELPERFVPSARCRARKVQPVPFFSSGMPHGAPPAFRSLFFSTTICLPAPC